MHRKESTTAPQFSTHDPACDYCRIKKIKCDRERPICNNCNRDEVQCGFSDKTKRVNQTKLLLENVGGIEERLSNLEKTLGSLSTLMKEINGRLVEKNDDKACLLSPPEQPQEADTYSNFKENLLPYSGMLTPSDSGDSRKSPHAAVKLSVLWEELRDSVTSVSHIFLGGSVADMLGELCKTENPEQLVWPTDIQPIASPLELPPKQLLTMACVPFFQSRDFSTDVFSQPLFWKNVDRIYTSEFETKDTAWAVSFFLIILLGLTIEPSSSESRSEFLEPYISTVTSSLNLASLFLTPNLINLQTLALLSLETQQFIQPQVRGTIFDQACHLAKQIATKTRHPSNDSETNEDYEELSKVQTILFIRDKSMALFKGRHISLPKLQWCPAVHSKLSGPAEPSIRARIELALIQEHMYLGLYSRKANPKSFKQQAAFINTMSSQLEFWNQTNRQLISGESLSSCTLHLEFLSTRAMALRLSSDLQYKEQVLEDSRSSCKMLASSDTHSTSFLKDTPLYLLTEHFSVCVLFSIFNNIIHSNVTDDTSADEDLLKQVSAAFLRSNTRSRNQNDCSGKLSQLLKVLVTIVEMVKAGSTDYFAQPTTQKQETTTPPQSSAFANLYLPDTFTSKGTSVKRPFSQDSSCSEEIEYTDANPNMPAYSLDTPSSHKRHKTSFATTPILNSDFPVAGFNPDGFYDSFLSENISADNAEWDFVK